MIVKVNVTKYTGDEFPALKNKYVARADISDAIYSYDDTMDGAISNFKRDYQALMEIQFAGGEQITFDFHVLL